VVGRTLNKFPQIKGSIALVGNAKSLLNHKFGSEIDSYDNVIRFGDAVTEGFEEQVGSKETHRFLCYPSGENGFEDTLSGKKIFLMAGNNDLLLGGVLKLVNKNEIYFITSAFRNTCNELTGKMCSLGMMAIQGFLDYKPTIYGFDFFKTLHYHQELKTDPQIFHNWDREKQIVEYLDSQNLVKWIKT
jgi:hypothetical protein